MIRYNTFMSLFIIAIVAFVIFIIFYLNGIFSFAFRFYNDNDPHLSPFEVIRAIFNPPMIISGLVFGISSLVCRVMGIISVARNKTVNDGEKALWIIGFILMGFITSVIYLVMAKGRNFAE